MLIMLYYKYFCFFSLDFLLSHNSFYIKKTFYIKKNTFNLIFLRKIEKDTAECFFKTKSEAESFLGY